MKTPYEKESDRLREQWEKSDAAFAKAIRLSNVAMTIAGIGLFFALIGLALRIALISGWVS